MNPGNVARKELIIRDLRLMNCQQVELARRYGVSRNYIHSIAKVLGIEVFKLSIEQRFWKYTYKTWNCWFWVGPQDKCGYGSLTINRETVTAHRLSFSLFVRQTENHVLHSCDTPQCVNPDHLFEGDPKSNCQDAMSKGRLRGRLRDLSLKY